MTNVETSLSSEDDLNACIPASEKVAIEKGDMEAEPGTAETSEGKSETLKSGKTLGCGLESKVEDSGMEEASVEALENGTQNSEAGAPNERQNVHTKVFILESLLVLGAYMFAISQVLGLTAQSYILSWVYGILNLCDCQSNA